MLSHYIHITCTLVGLRCRAYWRQCGR